MNDRVERAKNSHTAYLPLDCILANEDVDKIFHSLDLLPD
jgi:hypothetical protein